MQREAQMRVVCAIDTRKLARIECSGSRRRHRFLIGPFQRGHVSKVRVRSRLESVTQKSGNGHTDTLQIAAARRMRRLIFARQLSEKIRAHQAFDDWKCKRERTPECLVQLSAVDAKHRGRINDARAKVERSGRISADKERRG